MLMGLLHELDTRFVGWCTCRAGASFTQWLDSDRVTLLELVF